MKKEYITAAIRYFPSHDIATKEWVVRDINEKGKEVVRKATFSLAHEAAQEMNQRHREAVNRFPMAASN